MFASKLRLCLLGLLACGLLTLTADSALSGGGKAYDPHGEPKGFKHGLSARYAVWFHNGLWHLRTTTAKSQHHFVGKITVEGGKFDEAYSFHLEGKGKLEDHWKVHSKRHELTFDFKTDKDVDGLNFTLTKSATVIHFNLLIDGKHHAEKIYIGHGNHHPTSDPFSLPAHPGSAKKAKS